MLDIKLIRENTNSVKEKLALRNEDVSVIDKITDLDKKRLELILKTDGLKELRNKVTDEIAVMKKNKQEAAEKISEMKKVSDEIKMFDEELRKYDEYIGQLMKYIPNLPDDSVPHGKSEKDNVEIKKWGEKKCEWEDV